MAFVQNVKTGFHLALQSFVELFKRPWLMLYGIVPVVLRSLSNLLLQKMPVLKFGFAAHQFIFIFIIILSTAAFIYHMQSIFEDKIINARSVLYVLRSSFFSLLLLAVCTYGFRIFDTFLTLTFFDPMTQMSEALFFDSIMQSIWFIFTFYVLVFIVIEKASFLRAFFSSFKLLSHTFIRALCGILLIWFSIGIVKNSLWLLTANMRVHALLITPLFAGISLASYVFVLLLYRHHQAHKLTV
jgi:hypothetical protein